MSPLYMFDKDSDIGLAKCRWFIQQPDGGLSSDWEFQSVSEVKQIV
jgi:hypothetical protein